MMEKRTVQKILIIRSATFNFHRTIDFIKEAYPEAELDILLPEELSSGLRKDKRFHRVFSSSHRGHFGIFKLSQSLRREIRKRKYDLIVTLYNNKNGAGYLNVDMMAFLLKPGTRAAFNADDELVLITKRSLALRFAKEIAGDFFVTINDWGEEAYKLIKKNIEINGFKNAIASNENLNLLLSKKGYHYTPR